MASLSSQATTILNQTTNFPALAAFLTNDPLFPHNPLVYNSNDLEDQSYRLRSFQETIERYKQDLDSANRERKLLRKRLADVSSAPSTNPGKRLEGEEVEDSESAGKKARL